MGLGAAGGAAEPTAALAAAVMLATYSTASRTCWMRSSARCGAPDRRLWGNVDDAARPTGHGTGGRVSNGDEQLAHKILPMPPLLWYAVPRRVRVAVGVTGGPSRGARGDEACDGHDDGGCEEYGT